MVLWRSYPSQYATLFLELIYILFYTIKKDLQVVIILKINHDRVTLLFKSISQMAVSKLGQLAGGAVWLFCF